MEGERRRILESVREGSLAPDEALRILEELRDEDPEAPPTPVDEASSSPHDLHLLRVEHEVGTVTVRGDPSVAKFRVSGPHSVDEEGRTVVIKGEDSSFVGVGFVMGPGERRPHWRLPGKGKRHSTLEVDVNPSIPLDLRVEAGRLQVVGVNAPIKARVDLGTLTLERFDGPIDLKVESGTVNVDGVVSGRSRVACELGKVVALLDPKSDVRVEAKCSLGSLSLGKSNGDKQKRGGVSSAGGFQVGDGSGELDIKVEAGTIKVGVR